MDFNFLGKLIITVIFLTSSLTYAANSAEPIICDQSYALCTSARCIPDPSNANNAICDCAVNQGKSIGYKNCSERKSKTDKYNATHLISTFSFEQFTMKKSMVCPKGIAWTNCVDMPCTIDPQNPRHAICSCKINNTEKFFTFGGNCDIASCKTGFWSGATEAAGVLLRNALSKVEGTPTQTTCSPKN